MFESLLLKMVLSSVINRCHLSALKAVLPLRPCVREGIIKGLRCVRHDSKRHSYKWTEDLLSPLLFDGLPGEHEGIRHMGFGRESGSAVPWQSLHLSSEGGVGSLSCAATWGSTVWECTLSSSRSPWRL